MSLNWRVQQNTEFVSTKLIPYTTEFKNFPFLGSFTLQLFFAMV